MNMQEMQFDFERRELTKTGRKKRKYLSEAEWDEIILTWINLPYECSKKQFIEPYGVTYTPFVRRLAAYERGERTIRTRKCESDRASAQGRSIEVRHKGVVITFNNLNDINEIVRFINELDR